MPTNIAPLTLEDEEAWLDRQQDDVHVTIEEGMSEEWITTFEFRQVAQDNPYHVLYNEQHHVRSALIRPDSVDDVGQFQRDEWEQEVISFHPAENLTWRQFQEAITTNHQLASNFDQPCEPFMAYKEEHVGFIGFHTLASFSPSVIQKFHMAHKDFSVFEGDLHVGQFEAWQEGYPSDDYDDQPLSFGVRFRVRREFIQRVSRETGRGFAIRSIKNRFVMKESQQDPERQASSTSITVWPIMN